MRKSALLALACVAASLVFADVRLGEPVRKIFDRSLWIETLDQGTEPKIAIFPKFPAGRYRIKIELKTESTITFASVPDSPNNETGSQDITMDLIASAPDAEGVTSVSLRYESVRMESNGQVGQSARGMKKKVINIKGSEVVANPLDRIAKQMVSSSTVTFKIDRNGKLLEDSIIGSPDFTQQSYILMMNELMLLPKIGLGGEVRTTEKSEPGSLGKTTTVTEFKLRKINTTQKSRYAFVSFKSTSQADENNMSTSKIKSATGKGTIKIDLGDGMVKKVKKDGVVTVETADGGDRKTVVQKSSATITTEAMD